MNSITIDIGNLRNIGTQKKWKLEVLINYNDAPPPLTYYLTEYGMLLSEDLQEIEQLW